MENHPINITERKEWNFRKLNPVSDRARPALAETKQIKEGQGSPRKNYMEVIIMRIQHNIMALNSSRQLGVNNSAVAKSLEKLSSGYRINRAGDDAAGLAISEKMRAQIKGLEAASDNSQDAISLVQTAEGGLQEVHSMLNRMTELATKSANGTYTDNVDRQALQDEISALKDEINRIADGTDFNGIKLLDGTMGTGTAGISATTTAGTGTVAATEFSFAAPEGYQIDMKSAAGNTSISWDAGAKKLTISLKEGDTFTQEDINNLLAGATGTPAEAVGKVSITVGSTFEAKDGQILSGTSAAAKQGSKTMGTAKPITVTADKAGAVPAARTIQMKSAAGAAGVTVDATTGAVEMNLEAGKKYTSAEINTMLSEAGAGMSVKFDGEMTTGELTDAANGFGTAQALTGGAGLSAGGGLTLQIGDTNDSYNQLQLSIGDMHVNALDLTSVDISTREGASAAMAKIKTAINTVSTSRGKLGAIQNRLEHTINNLGVTTENITSAESRIRDVDMAKEMMNYTKNSVLVQSAQAMLAQANQQPQSILQLLQ